MHSAMPLHTYCMIFARLTESRPVMFEVPRVAAPSSGFPLRAQGGDADLMLHDVDLLSPGPNNLTALALKAKLSLHKPANQ